LSKLISNVLPDQFSGLLASIAASHALQLASYQFT